MITLDLVKQRFLNQIPIIFLILGSIGFIGDAFTFLQPNLRYNTFCIYSFLRSFIDMTNLYVNLFPNYLYGGGTVLAIIVDTQSCRWKLFGLVAVPQLSMNLLILSLIDRFSCTCALTSPIQKMRELKYVPYLIIITIGISSVMSLYSPLLYDYTPGVGCVTTDFKLNGSLYVILHGLLTPLLMLVFVWLTHRNVRHSRQRVVSVHHVCNFSFNTQGFFYVKGAVTNAAAHRPRHQFISLVFTQVITTAFFVLQWIGMYLYHISTLSYQRTPEQWAIHYFVFSLTNYIYYLNNVKSFYLSTLTSRLFRETFIKSLGKIVSKTPIERTMTM